MKYAIISDIHGNLEALESVLTEIEKHYVDSLLCLGDVVGYGPNPNECVEVIRDKAEVILAGNHDYAPLGKLDLSYFNPWARNAIEWTADQLSESSKEFLLSLPLKMNLNGFTIVHSTPLNPEQWNYIITIGDAVRNFHEFEGRVCFVGHSHVPMIVSVKNEDYRAIRENPLQIDPDRRYIINVGSVGQPRDLIPRAAYAIYDTTNGTYELFRVDYDIAETQSKIIQSGLPEFLAERLELGQ
ncbi:metallophosphoesterase family protein [candidate division KSB1 bacterium]|nr:metallophosphoesterase family protein [candidate division KSB1 bacterium]NIR73456.1 metallophosphoesterase family protein [candidate division KSB1 bacterium]NIS27071.1 metallophosphoesterase family protein [candidate division KSB1 bacterium]NIT73915.1 metallophosphoesterase family protein [candidate division KSB1 bacterium]NIU27816.1 metallophosphoesterase family protein [candidate division KSB1 bacterium]